ncbi:DUF5080 domain-containing protein [Staphylococcus condimenti]|uniref:DUF5080 family protein n=2 Tax=Staphylococcus condimenti TaxID=70255 RepID=A0A143PB41_9STAP|nr:MULTISPECIES: DUF5080 family protein [Staphylococcus]AMY05697.1 hypothetical protein A4G25_07050 [Staphylococcus condimenti]APR61904.1 DUF5080 domain-containing protein [Staphylococcus condimenti]MDK8646250.1 DUF5080 family protein [Staphylococcus condimenti]OFO99152.1 hypothetical protein HMPREF3007_06460 [Staphylococcus sp. HMSC065E08]PNZ59080.1 DUF5080 domain-containing protein [Staphylococcus condimenti]
MTYLLLFLVAGLYYVVYITSVMYAEGIKLLPWIAYGISAVIFLVTFLFVNPSFSALQNYIFVLTLGFVVYGWLAIKSFWTRPYQVKIESMESNPNYFLTREKYEEDESVQINLASAKYKGIISGIISVICMIAIKLKLTPILKEDLAGGLFTIGLILFLMVIIYFIIDIILVIRRRRFSFIILRPLGTLVLLIFFAMII